MDDEFSIIRDNFASQRIRRSDVVVGIGDDAAVVSPRGGKDLVCTTDLLLSGIHFPENTEPRAVGYKSLAVNLSDIAAMGAEPAWATMLLSLPGADTSWLQEFNRGFQELAARYELQLIGGDLVRGPLAVGIQVMGYVDPDRSVLRSGARIGDHVYVSGFVGDACLGLSVLKGKLSLAPAEREYAVRRLEYPSPRVELGSAIAAVAHAAIDVSDGMCADLDHITVASNVGACIQLERVPVSEVYKSHLGEVGWEPALAGGDDFELCFTAPPDSENELKRIAADLDIPVTRIGWIEAGSGVRVVHDGEVVELRSKGYNHFASQ